MVEDRTYICFYRICHQYKNYNEIKTIQFYLYFKTFMYFTDLLVLPSLIRLFWIIILVFAFVASFSFFSSVFLSLFLSCSFLSLLPFLPFFSSFFYSTLRLFNNGASPKCSVQFAFIREHGDCIAMMGRNRRI